MAEYSPDLRTVAIWCGSENISGFSMPRDHNGVRFARGSAAETNTERTWGIGPVTAELHHYQGMTHASFAQGRELILPNTEKALPQLALGLLAYADGGQGLSDAGSHGPPATVAKVGKDSGEILFPMVLAAGRGPQVRAPVRAHCAKVHVPGLGTPSAGLA